jgi:hypothetical protein
MARVKWVKEVRLNNSNDWTLCFQWCEYIYGDEDDTREFGYRFIWRRPDGSLQAARGQARIPSFSDMNELLGLAKKEGWLEKIETQI